ncbi:MAG: hypothetical protein ACE5J3_07955, partial [Methanosarcinales archaeon]
ALTAISGYYSAYKTKKAEIYFYNRFNDQITKAMTGDSGSKATIEIEMYPDWKEILIKGNSLTFVYKDRTSTYSLSYKVKSTEIITSSGTYIIVNNNKEDFILEALFES